MTLGPTPFLLPLHDWEHMSGCLQRFLPESMLVKTHTIPRNIKIVLFRDTFNRTNCFLKIIELLTFHVSRLTIVRINIRLQLHHESAKVREKHSRRPNTG